MADSDVRFSYQSALCLIPAEENWEGIQEIRSQHDRAYERWMPHINLFFPFIEDALEDGSGFSDFAEQTLTPLLKKIPAFTVKVDHFDGFIRKKDAQMYLGVDDDSELQNLWQQIRSVIPNRVRDKNRPNFTPHMSVGQFKKKDYKQTLQEYQSSDKAFFEWRISEVCLISRGKDTPFEIRHRVQLG